METRIALLDIHRASRAVLAIGSHPVLSLYVVWIAVFASFATKASHFAVYNNLADVPPLSAYPGAFPAQYTVPAGKTVRNLTFHITLDASSGN